MTTISPVQPATQSQVSIISHKATASVDLKLVPVNVLNLLTVAKNGLTAIPQITTSFLSYVSSHTWTGNLNWAKLEYSFLQNDATYDVRIMDDGFNTGITIWKDGIETNRYMVG